MSYLNNFKTELSAKLKKNSGKKKKATGNTKEEQVQTNEANTSANNSLSNQYKTISVNQTENNSIDNNQKVVTNTNGNNTTNESQTLVSGAVSEATKEDDPIAKLKELEERYELLEFYDAPDSLGLEEKEVPTFDEEQTKNKLQSQYDDIYGAKKESLKSEYENAVNDLTQEKLSAEELAKNNEEKINMTFDNESSTLENQAIKRGLARSSIILGQLANVESERANNLLDNMNTLQSNLASIESKIEEKTKDLDLALEKLDIEKADKIESELEKAYKEYQDTLNDVIEFNNNVKKLEAEYKIKYEQAKTEYKDSVLDLTKYGYDEYKKKLELSKYDYMISYLSQFDKDDAFEIFFRDSNFKDLLGEYYYQKVIDYLYSRL